VNIGKSSFGRCCISLRTYKKEADLLVTNRHLTNMLAWNFIQQNKIAITKTY